MAMQPIIIKKIKKNKPYKHYGGMWKLAYADFVTAMMAFFLLMWILGSTTQDKRKGIAEYFSNPYKASLIGGDAVGNRTSVIQGGGSDLNSRLSGQVDQGETPKIESALQIEIQQAEIIDLAQLEALKEKIQAMIDAKPELNEFKEQIKLEITHEGLRILIIDSQNRPMFNLASAATAPHIRLILKELAPVINELPNKISINGHTDARPFPGNQTGYSNWELSSDRANAARQELVKNGVAEAKVMRVVGLASSAPYNVRNSLDPMNRRISVVVMTHKSEEHLLQDMSAEPHDSTEIPQ
ncbi:MAG: flagellar motor protein MotB [Methylococcaceae bacterium]|nr:flagellar motor protein MotB [Methylococcaceae bacterium]